MATFLISTPIYTTLDTLCYYTKFYLKGNLNEIR